MKRIIAAISVISIVFLTAWTHGDPGKEFNLISDIGATCNGVVDDGPAFNAAAGVAMRAYQATHPTAPVTLRIPPGSNCLLLTCPAGSDGKGEFGNVYNITIIATGATVTAKNAGNCGIYRGTMALPYAADKFVPNSIGAQCVTMVVPGAEANYTVGKWAMVSGEGVQVNSYPPNYANFEYQQIASNTSGKLCFTKPLANVYPNDATAGIDLTNQNCGGNSCGGPGGVTPMSPDWGSYFHVVGGIWDFHVGGGSVHWGGLDVSFTNVTWNGDPMFNEPNACWFPSFNGTVTWNNSVIHRCNTEVDKNIDKMIFNGTVSDNQQFQSPSVHSLAINAGSNVPTFGTPAIVTCNNSSTTLNFGTTYGGTPGTFSGVNCAMQIGGGNAFNGFGYDGVTVTYASGEFTVPNVNVCGGGIPQWVSIGQKMVMGGEHATDADNYFTITSYSVPIEPPDDITGPCHQDLHVFTTLPNSTVPPFSAAGGGGGSNAIAWAQYRYPTMTCTGCSGIAPDLVGFDLNFPAAQNKPLYTYTNRTYTCANNIVNVPGSYDINTIGTSQNAPSLRGHWVTWSANVITADTNPSDTFAQFNFGAGQEFDPVTGVESFHAAGANFVNLHITGTRTITPSGITGTQSGDTLAATAFGTDTWLAGAGTNISAGGITNGPAGQCPVVQLIGQTM